MAEWEDREIINQVLQGNSQLFTLLVEKYQKSIFNYVFRLVRQRQEAEDLAQETFVKAFFALPQYDNSYQFSTWIFRIALNLCRDYFRKKKLPFLSLHEPIGDDENGELEDMIEQQAFLDPDGEILNQELRTKLEKAIDQLPLKFKEVVILRHLENLSYEEIAQVTGLPIGTVKTYLHRARKALRKELRKYLD
ncbi:MAG: polymerase sigma-70 factor, subfamily [Candidatus Atribacteria bacterium]|nr:polymerase sigma-70 factor, subfamily [Candidatus Atribacteria bacterium]